MKTPQHTHTITRRKFIGTSLAAAAFMPSFVASGAEPHHLLAPKAPMLPPKAKSIIVIVTQGGMSQMDTFDPKPELDRYDGKKLTPGILPGLGEVKTFFGGKDGSPLMRSPYKFAKHGQCGMDVSELPGQCPLIWTRRRPCCASMRTRSRRWSTNARAGAFRFGPAVARSTCSYFLPTAPLRSNSRRAGGAWLRSRNHSTSTRPGARTILKHCAPSLEPKNRSDHRDSGIAGWLIA